MHRNTYFFVSVLAIFAALLVGVNLGKKLTKQPAPAQSLPRTTPTPEISLLTYTDTYCGFSLTYPSNFDVLENASGSAILHTASDTTQAITLTCQKTIPRPTGTADTVKILSIPTTTGASISATLYTDTAASTDAIIFRHPTNGMDDFIAGYGNAFTAAIKTIRILP